MTNPLKYYVPLAVVFFFAGAAIRRQNSAASSNRVLSQARSSSASSALADGCHHVFIDAGSNRGVHGRIVFEPEKYPQSKFVSLFQEVFGNDRANQDMCVFAFEPNPLHRERQAEIAETYERMGWRYHFIPAALMDEDGEMTFYRNSQEEQGKDEKEEWGFSMRLKGVPEITSTVEMQAINVPIINFSKWFTDNVVSRKLPGETSSKANQGPPRVYMKIDVEGAEFRVLARLNADGNMCHFDKITGEVHPFNPEVESMQLHPDWVALGYGWEQKKIFMESLNLLMKASGCPTVDSFDDESYLHDGAPMPSRLQLR